LEEIKIVNNIWYHRRCVILPKGQPEDEPPDHLSIIACRLYICGKENYMCLMFYILCANAILCKCAIVLQCANVLQYPGSHAIVFLAKCSALCFVQGLTAFVAYSQQIVLFLLFLFLLLFLPHHFQRRAFRCLPILVHDQSGRHLRAYVFELTTFRNTTVRGLQ
jgi:hypothetical protein